MLAMLSLLFATQLGAQQDQETFTFKSRVSNVRVDVQASEGYTLIKDLNKEDFVVFDRNVQQNLLYFDRGDEPLSVLLLLDISGSMERYIEDMASAAQQALKHLRPRDRVGVMIFARETKLTLPFTDDFGAVETAIRESVKDETVGTATEMNAALVDAAEFFDKGSESGRRAILILTDNKGLSYKLNDEDVTRALFGADVVVNALVVGRAEPPAPPRQGTYVNPDFTPFNIFKIAEETGGETAKMTRARIEFPRMVERIRMRYGLQYRMPDTAQPGVFRSIRVDLTPAARARYPNAELRYRKGYIPREM